MKTKGFSLIELMLVVVIIGLSISLTIPSFRSFNKSRSLREAAYSFAGIIRYVQSQAASRGLHYQMSILDREPWLNFSVEENPLTEPGNFVQTRLPSTIHLNALEGCEQIKMTELTPQGRFDTQNIHFYPDGTTSSIFCYLTNEEKKIYTVALAGASGICMVYDHETGSYYE